MSSISKMKPVMKQAVFVALVICIVIILLLAVLGVKEQGTL